MSSSEKITLKLIEIRKELTKVGFTDAQIDTMIQARKKRANISYLPFRNTNISDRYTAFKNLFQPYGLSSKNLNELLSCGLMFSMHPNQYKQLFQFIENQGVSIEKFLKTAQTDNGRIVLACSPNRIIKNIQQMSQTLQPYGITSQKWIEMGIKRPTILKQTPHYLLSNIEKMTHYLSVYGFTQADWIAASQRNPAILEHNAAAMIQKNKEMFSFLAQYQVSPDKWIETSLKLPQLFYTDSRYLQARFQFYTDAYQAGQFIFTQLKQQDTHHLIQTLLTSPQYLCYSEENLNCRKAYMIRMNKTTGQASSGVLYRPLSYIKKELERLNNSCRE